MVKKENIVTCRNCGRSFDNYYRVKSKWREFNCSRECAKIQRKKHQFLKNKERRHKLRKEHKCIICKEKIKPVIIYNQFCPKHKQKVKKNEL